MGGGMAAACMHRRYNCLLACRWPRDAYAFCRSSTTSGNMDYKGLSTGHYLCKQRSNKCPGIIFTIWYEYHQHHDLLFPFHHTIMNGGGGMSAQP